MAKEEKNKRQRQLYAERATAGLCTYCGKNQPAIGRLKCQPCINYKILKIPPLPPGVCSRCRKRVVIVGMARCFDCNQTEAEWRAKQRESVYIAYGNKCACPPCGETRWQFLVLDHINDDGAVHRKEIGHSKLVYWAAANGCPPILRLLCANCNTGRERNGGICPHLAPVV